MKNQKRENEWEKEMYEILFTTVGDDILRHNKFRDFIIQLLEAERNRVVKDIMEEIEKMPSLEGIETAMTAQEGYDKALNDLKSLLERKVGDKEE